MKNKNGLIVVLVVIILVFAGILALKIFIVKSVEEGMDYAAEKSIESRERLDAQSEKESIQLAIVMAMFGDNTAKELTYNNFDEQLKSTFGSGNYKLTGPDNSGVFTLNVNTRTYKINTNGTILDNTK